MSFVTATAQAAFPAQSQPAYPEHNYAAYVPRQPYLPYAPLLHTDLTHPRGERAAYPAEKAPPQGSVISTCSSTSHDAENERVNRAMSQQSFSPAMVVRRTSASKCMSLSDMSIIPLDDPVPQKPQVQESRVWQFVKRLRRNVGKVWGTLSVGMLTVFEIMSKNSDAEHGAQDHTEEQRGGNWV